MEEKEEEDSECLGSERPPAKGPCMAILDTHPEGVGRQVVRAVQSLPVSRRVVDV